jgi:hypothetical protein
MMVLVTALTVCRERLRELHQAVFDRLVALAAFDACAGDVGTVHEVQFPGLLCPCLLGMTTETAVAANIPIPLGDVEMAVLAGHALRQHFRMIENDSLVIYRLLLETVTGTAPAAKLLRTEVLEMAEEAGAFRYRHVVSLDDLGMTGCTSQRHSSPVICQMVSVAEGDVLETNVLPHEPAVVTTIAQTGCIRDRGPGLGSVGPGEVLRGHGELREPALELYPQAVSGGVVTVHAGYVTVAGSSPTVKEGLHVVAGGAERGLLRILGNGGEGHKK